MQRELSLSAQAEMDLCHVFLPGQNCEGAKSNMISAATMKHRVQQTAPCCPPPQLCSAQVCGGHHICRVTCNCGRRYVVRFSSEDDGEYCRMLLDRRESSPARLRSTKSRHKTHGGYRTSDYESVAY